MHVANKHTCFRLAHHRNFPYRHSTACGSSYHLSLVDYVLLSPLLLVTAAFGFYFFARDVELVLFVVKGVY
jgi:hypothetical protein